MLGVRSLKGFDQRVWVLFVGRIISATGFSIVMPFPAIHLNRDMDVSMSEVGLLFLGMAVGGVLYDGLHTEPIALIAMISAIGSTYLGKVTTSSYDTVTEEASGAKG